MERRLGYLFKSINDKLKKQADEDLKSNNLTLSQSRIAFWLSARGGVATQKEIEDELAVSHPTVVGLVSRMEQNGMVQTYYDNGARSKAVKLTEKAVLLSEGMIKTINKNEDKMLQGLSEEEVDALERTLTIILQNLEK